MSNPKTRNGGKWTEARFTAFVKSALRGASTRWGPKYEALNEAKVGKQINKLTGRVAEHYKCASCGGLFPAKQVKADHIDPVIEPEVGFVSWDVFISRLLVEKEGYQVICTDCHNKKSNIEKERAKNARARH